MDDSNWNITGDSFVNQFKGNNEEDRNQNGHTASYSEQFLTSGRTEFHGAGANGFDDAHDSAGAVPDGYSQPIHFRQESAILPAKDEYPFHENPYSGNSVDPVPEKNNRRTVSWRYLDLRNKKQTGDLYKRILFYNRKKSGQEAKVFKAINFVASRKGEGVTTILSNLAAYVDNQRKNILIIDANLQFSGLNQVFGISDGAPGLADIFNSQASLQSVVLQVSPTTAFLPAGSGNIKSSTSLEQDRFSELLKHCRKSYDFIFIDCPPVLSSADALTIASAADLSFLVVQSASVQRPVIERTKTLLQNDECEIGGVILNRVQQVIPGWLYRYI